MGTTGGTNVSVGSTIAYQGLGILGSMDVTATSTADPGASATATVRVVALPRQACASQYGSAGTDPVMAMAIDSADNVLIVGYAYGDLFAVDRGGTDAFVAKSSPSGVPLVEVQHSTNGNDQVDAVAVDSAGRIVHAP